MRHAVFEQQVFGGRMGKVPINQIRDAGLLNQQAKKKHLFDADTKTATLLLQQALTSAPYAIPAWLSLAELYNDQGKKHLTFQVLEYSDRLLSGVKRWRWEKTLVDYQVGRTGMLPAELGFIIGEIPGKPRTDALQLSFTLWENPADLLANIGLSNVEHLFDYTIQKNLQQKGLFFWRVIQNNNISLSEKKVLSFLEMLLRNGDVNAASIIWKTHFHSASIVFNGDFKKRFLQQAFGWRQSNSKAFTMNYERKADKESPGSLHYNFKGWENVNFHHLYQIVPVEGGQHYTFSGEFKSKRLTTDQRPFIEVYGYKCKTPYAKSEMVQADQDWSSLHLNFVVSEECQAVVVRLRRQESHQIDNKLTGQMWLRNFKIEKITDPYTALDGLTE